MTKIATLLCAVLALGAACAESKGMTPPPSLDVLQVLPASKRVEVGERFALGAQRVEGRTAENVTAMASLRSDDEAVLRVSGTTAEAISPGTAHVIVEHDGLTGTAEVIVSAAVSDIELDVGDLALATGSSLQLGAVLFAGDDKRAFDSGSWGSLDPAIASVDDEGVVTGRSAGSATITLSREGLAATTTVRVADWALSGLQLTASTGAQLPVGEAASVRVRGEAGPRTQDVTDLFALSVSEDSTELVALAGTEITATAAGTATLLATGKAQTIAAGMSAELAIETIAKERLQQLSFDLLGPAALDMAPLDFRVLGDYGDGLSLPTTPDSVTAEPATALSIDLQSGKLSPLEAADVTLSVTVKAPDEKREIEAVTVLSILDEPLSGLTITAAPSGATVQLTATAAYGSSVTQDVTDLVRWTSDDPAIAVVSNVRAGHVTTLASGVVTLSARYRGQAAALQLSLNAP